MDETLFHKFVQHSDFQQAEMLGTGDAELIEVAPVSAKTTHSLTAVQDSHKDAFWGVGADGQGRNEL